MASRFSEWKKKNPGGSFEGFRHEVREESIRTLTPVQDATSEHRSSSKSKRDKALIYTAFLIVISWILYFSAKEFPGAIGYARQYIHVNTEAFASWKAYVNQEANFEIRFPGQPLEGIEKPRKEEHALSHLTFSYSHPEEDGYAVRYDLTYRIYPTDAVHSDRMETDDAEAFLEYMIEDLLEQEKGILMKNAPIVYGLYPGRVLTIVTSQWTMDIRCRMYLIENAVYLIRVTSPNIPETDKAVNYYLNSFKLLSYAQS